ncbi:hypothetical protein D3C77_424140 [compost metagenome]
MLYDFRQRRQLYIDGQIADDFTGRYFLDPAMQCEYRLRRIVRLNGREPVNMAHMRLLNGQAAVNIQQNILVRLGIERPFRRIQG